MPNRNPFNCGPNPCRWPCGEVEPPPPPERICVPITTHSCPYSTLSNWGVSKHYLSVAGVAVDSCADCADYNGDFDLWWDPAPGNPDPQFTWKSPEFAGTTCGKPAGDPLWSLYHGGGGADYILTANGVGVEYRLAQSSWECNGINTLSLVTPTPAGCSGWPSSLDLLPCLSGCAGCIGYEAPLHMLLEIPDLEPSLSGAPCSQCDLIGYRNIIVEWYQRSGNECLWQAYFPNPAPTCSAESEIRVQVSLNYISDWRWTAALYFGGTLILGYSHETGIIFPDRVDCLAVDGLALTTKSPGEYSCKTVSDPFRLTAL